MNILVTGGAGFIGSHVAVELVNAGHTVMVIDNFSNSEEKMIKNVETLTNKQIDLYKCDIRDSDSLKKIFQTRNIDVVMHFAALKAVGESVQRPLAYYENNVGGLMQLLEIMLEHEVYQLIFSSSATVYGDPDEIPITENTELKPASNPYGATKQMCERIVEDTCNASQMRAVLLRYFNPVGAHQSGQIGELPIGTPSNLVPFVAQAAAGIQEELKVRGNDYGTPDGTGVRDYIHVVDLAKAHVAAMNYLPTMEKTTDIFNIGTGVGNSVLEVIQTFEKVNNVKVPYSIGPRRPGDIATCYCSAEKAQKVLGWKAQLTLEDAMRDAWNWQQRNSN